MKLLAVWKAGIHCYMIDESELVFSPGFAINKLVVVSNKRQAIYDYSNTEAPSCDTVAGENH